MPEIRDTARRIVTSNDLALSTVRLQPGGFAVPGAFSKNQGNAREARCSVAFRTANAPTVLYHGLGFVPSGFQVLGKNTAGVIYSDLPLRATSRVIVLKCDTANTLADILVR